MIFRKYVLFARNESWAIVFVLNSGKTGKAVYNFLTTFPNYLLLFAEKRLVNPRLVK